MLVETDSWSHTLSEESKKENDGTEMRAQQVHRNQKKLRRNTQRWLQVGRIKETVEFATFGAFEEHQCSWVWEAMIK